MGVLLIPKLLALPLRWGLGLGGLLHWEMGREVRPAPLSMGFSRQEYWSGLPFPPGEIRTYFSS